MVEGGRIKALASGSPAGPEGSRTIDCGGRVVMPGLIDAHWHSIFAALPIPTLLSAELGYIFLAASAEAERTLMRGFTTVRDLGGPSFALKQAIDEGLAPGTAHLSLRRDDHHDRRPWRHAAADRHSARPGGPVSHMEATGAANIADSADEVRLQGARAAPAGRVPDQARRRRGRVVAAHHSRHADLQRARIARGRGGGRRPQHLRRRARLSARRHPAGDRCGRPVHRARAPDGRGDGEPDGGQGRLAQHPAVHQRGRHRSPSRAKPGEPASGHCRLEHSLSVGEGPQAQDRLRLGHAVFRPEDHAPGDHADPSQALVRQC